MDRDTSTPHTACSSPETEVLTPGSQITSDQSTPGTTTGYVWINRADSASDPRTVPRTLPSVPRSPDPRALETSSSRAWQNSWDDLTPTPQRHYSLLSGSDEETYHRDIGNGRSSNHRLSSSASYRAGSLTTGSTSASSTAGLRTNTHELGQSPRPREEDSHQPEQSDLTHPGQFGEDVTSKAEEYGVTVSSSVVVVVVVVVVVNSTPAPTSMPIRSRQSRDTLGSLDSRSRGTQEQRSIDVHNNQVGFLPVNPSDSEQDSLGYLTQDENNIRDLFGLPSECVGHPITMNADSSAVRQPQSKDVLSSSDPGVKVSQDSSFQQPRQSAEPAPTHADSQSCDLSFSHNLPNDNTAKDFSVSDSLATRPGLHMRLSSTSSTSTDMTGTADSEYLASESEHEPVSVATNSLMRQLITCLLADWFWDSRVLDFNNPAENFRKCPQGSGAGQASRSAGKKRSMESPRQDNNSSSHGESDEESDREGNDQSGRRRRKIQKVDDSSPRSPRLLACPFHKMDPMRYSGHNELEKEYRKCSSGYWPDIPRLK
jgi:hypothetical protein